jgi:hypothetical protein
MDQLKRIVVGHDLKAGGETALKSAVVLAGRSDAALRLVHVVEPHHLYQRISHPMASKNNLEEIVQQAGRKLQEIVASWEAAGIDPRRLKMKKRQMKTVIAVLLVLLVPKPSLAYSRSDNDPAESRSQRFLTPDEEFIMAFNSAKALPYLASARKDIVRNNIPGAQREVGQALTLVDQVKSRFPVIRLEELIAAARIRLSYEEPKQALAYLELITPALANIQEPAASREVMAALARAKAFLKTSDKEAADHELVTVVEVLNYKTAARPVGLVEKYLLTAEAQLDKSQLGNADRSITAAEDSLRFMAVQVDTSMFQKKQSLWQRALDYTRGVWSAAEEDLDRASALVKQAVKGASGESRTEIQNLDRDIHVFLKKSPQSQGSS